MLHFPGLDAMVTLWGAAVLTYATIRYYFFDSRIQIDLPVHRGRVAGRGAERT
jgi:hypothetical protein